VKQIFLITEHFHATILTIDAEVCLTLHCSPCGKSWNTHTHLKGC